MKNSLGVIDHRLDVSQQKINEFEKVHIYEMNKEYSIDLDEPLDWIFAEAVFNAGLV